MTEDDLVNALSLLHADEDVLAEMTAEELMKALEGLWQLRDVVQTKIDRVTDLWRRPVSTR